MVVEWKAGGYPFTYDTYTRDHQWKFPHGEKLRASAAPEYKGSVDAVDPEQALVAAIASCHMLTFLAIAARKRRVVLSYRDEPVGHLEKNDDGKLAITRVVLHPRIEWEVQPDHEVIERIHQLAHKECFIANSVTCRIEIEAD